MIRPGLTLPESETNDATSPDAGRPAEPVLQDLFQRLRLQTARRGEERLALAVLEDAIRCLEKNPETGRHLPAAIRKETEDWIASRDRVHLFSFENVCAVLYLDADHIRRQVLTRPEHRALLARRRFGLRFGNPRRYWPRVYHTPPGPV